MKLKCVELLSHVTFLMTKFSRSTVVVLYMHVYHHQCINIDFQHVLTTNVHFWQITRTNVLLVSKGRPVS